MQSLRARELERWSVLVLEDAIGRRLPHSVQIVSEGGDVTCGTSLAHFWSVNRTIKRDDFLERFGRHRMPVENLARLSNLRSSAAAIGAAGAAGGQPTEIDTPEEWTALFETMSKGADYVELTPEIVDDLAELEEAAGLAESTWRKMANPLYLEAPSLTSSRAQATQKTLARRGLTYLLPDVGHKSPTPYLSRHQYEMVLNDNYTSAVGGRIGFGTKGEAVERIQARLIQAGLLFASEPDGYWGPKTEAAYYQAIKLGAARPLSYHPGAQPHRAAQPSQPSEPSEPARLDPLQPRSPDGFSPGISARRALPRRQAQSFGSEATIREAAKHFVLASDQHAIQQAISMVRTEEAVDGAMPTAVGWTASIGTNGGSVGPSATWELGGNKRKALRVERGLLSVREARFRLEAARRRVENRIRGLVFAYGEAEAKYRAAQSVVHRLEQQQLEIDSLVEHQKIDPSAASIVEAALSDAKRVAVAYSGERATARDALMPYIPRAQRSLPIRAPVLSGPGYVSPVSELPTDEQLGDALLDSPAMKAEYARYEAAGVGVEQIEAAQRATVRVTIGAEMLTDPDKMITALASAAVGLMFPNVNADENRARFEYAKSLERQVSAKNFEALRDDFFSAREARRAVLVAQANEAATLAALAEKKEARAEVKDRLPSAAKEEQLTELARDISALEIELISHRSVMALALADLDAFTRPAETVFQSTSPARPKDFVQPDGELQIEGFQARPGALQKPSELFNPKSRPRIWQKVLDWLEWLVSAGGNLWKIKTETHHRQQLIRDAAADLYERLTPEERVELRALLASTEFSSVLDEWRSLSKRDRRALSEQHALEPLSSAEVERRFSFVVDVARAIRSRGTYQDSEIEAMTDAGFLLTALQEASRNDEPISSRTEEQGELGSSSDGVPTLEDGEVRRPAADRRSTPVLQRAIPRRPAMPSIERAPPLEVARVKGGPSAASAPDASQIENARQRIGRVMDFYEEENRWLPTRWVGPANWSNDQGDAKMAQLYASVLESVQAMDTPTAEAFVASLSDAELDALTKATVRGPGWLSRQLGDSPELGGQTVFEVLMKRIDDGDRAARLMLAWNRGFRYLTSSNGARQRRVSEAHVAKSFELGQLYLRRGPSDINKDNFIRTLMPSVERGTMTYAVGANRSVWTHITADPNAALVAAALAEYERSPMNVIDEMGDQFEMVVFAARVHGITGSAEDAVSLSGLLGTNQRTRLPTLYPEPFMGLLQGAVRWGDERFVRRMNGAFDRLPGSADNAHFKRLTRSDDRGVVFWKEELNAVMTSGAPDDALQSARRLVGDLVAEPPDAGVVRADVEKTTARLRLLVARISDGKADALIEDLPAPDLEALIAGVGHRRGGVETLGAIANKVGTERARRAFLSALGNALDEGGISKRHYIEIGRHLLAKQPPLSNQEKLGFVKMLSNSLRTDEVYDPRGLLIAETLTAMKNDRTAFRAGMEELVDRSTQGVIVDRSRMLAVERAALVPEGVSTRNETPLFPLLPGGGPGTASNRSDALVAFIDATASAGTNEQKALVFYGALRGLYHGVAEHHKVDLATLGLSNTVREVTAASLKMWATGQTAAITDEMMSIRGTDPGAVAWNLTGLMAMGDSQWRELGRLGGLSEQDQIAAVKRGAPFFSEEMAARGEVAKYLKLGMDKLSRGPSLAHDPVDFFWYADRGGPDGRPGELHEEDVRRRQAFVRGGLSGGLAAFTRSVARMVRHERLQTTTIMSIMRESISLIDLTTDIVGGSKQFKGDSNIGAWLKRGGKAAVVGSKIYMHYQQRTKDLEALRSELAVAAASSQARQSASLAFIYPHDRDHARFEEELNRVIDDYLGTASRAAKYGEQFRTVPWETSVDGGEMRSRAPELLGRE